MQIILLVLTVLASLFFWQKWQGPEVSAMVIKQQPLVQSVVASGEVRSQSLARIGSEITGIIKARHVREGDAVKPGDLLLELNNDEQQARVYEAEAALQQLVSSSRRQAQAAQKEAEANLDQAQRERARREALQERQLLSDEQVEQARRSELSARVSRDKATLQAAALASGGTEEQILTQRLAASRALLAKTRVVSHVAGIVQTRNVEPGDLVQPGRILLEIATANSLEVVVKVDEKNMARLVLGQPAQIIADAYPDNVVPAHITFIAPAIDTARGTVDIHLSVDAQTDFLKQGMTVSATMETGRRDNALVIANDALREVNADSAVVMRVENSKAERVVVKLGMRGMAQSEVREGLKSGDTILLDDIVAGSRVRPKTNPLRVSNE
ncbi:MAG: efflux RND transporter periplasmic adaptor subunit [Moraxellaceae bacterium]|nr:efflux RND transporter periplasmic adaptor subunit [Moraxellaceae bacterium]MBP9046250.1 efflux RND transporter periplasmic adaptor subunit [Moraxellaceae bacterium]MBP9731482.1 efflux RND transporter periplasmic adaptor subunit [Moraxellaceae bacterium]